MWYSGIDQHKRFCFITSYGPTGPRVKQARVASTPLPLPAYFAEFPGSHQAVVESTGAWYGLADTLAALGVELFLAHATRDLMRTRLRLVEKSPSAQNSIDRLLEKFNASDVAALAPLYQLPAACHAVQIQLLEEQIRTLERALHPPLIPDADVQRLLWIPGFGTVNAFIIQTEIDGITLFAGARRARTRAPGV